MKIKGITNTWPSYSAKEVKKISTILKSGKVNYWTGEECRNFEEEFASYVGTKRDCASNGMVAIDLALRALNKAKEMR